MKKGTPQGVPFINSRLSPQELYPSDGVADTAPTWRPWLGADVLQAALEELAEPVLATNRAQLEREAEAVMGDVLRTVVRAPEGGFRVRFAAILRSRLLEKDEPLLLLRRAP